MINANLFIIFIIKLVNVLFKEKNILFYVF